METAIFYWVYILVLYRADLYKVHATDKHDPLSLRLKISESP